MRLIWGEKTGLRRFEERMTDAEMLKLYEWSRDEEVLRWSGGSPTDLSLADFREHLHAERLYGPTNRRAFLIFAASALPRDHSAQSHSRTHSNLGPALDPGIHTESPAAQAGSLGPENYSEGPEESEVGAHNQLELIGRLGIFGIDWDKREGELGIVIGVKEYWGRGFGRDAVRTLIRHLFTTSSLERIYLYTFVDNVRAQRSFAAAGFHVVDHGRRFTPEVGEFDGVQMEISRADLPQVQTRKSSVMPRGKK